MLFNKKALLLLGIAAGYLAYRYSKLSTAEKNSLKEKGKKIMEDYLPDNLKNMFGETVEENLQKK